MKGRNTTVLACFLLFVTGMTGFSARFSYAEIPKTIQYEGKLASKGKVVDDGTYTMVFSIYDSATGGTALWTETQQVKVTSGIFATLLGSTTPLTLSFDKQYWVGLSVNNGAEMTPRQAVSSVGYAFTAGSASSALTAVNADKVDNFHASSTPTANTLLPLDSNAKVPASVLDTTGATNMVTQIVAGTNVTISPSSGTGAVTISATGGSGGGSGTVTSVATGTGLTGGPVTSSGTISIASGGVSTTEILDGTIANADISNTAAISSSKISGLGALAALNTVGSSEITDGAISFSDMGANGCAANEIMKYNGAAWACAADATGGSGGGVSLTSSSTQTMQATADVVPLIIKDDTVGTTANLFDVQNNAGTSLVKVNGSGNLLVGSPVTTTPELSVYETGTSNAGYFQTNNAANANPALYAETNGASSAVYGTTTGTGQAGYFQISNAGNSASLIAGNTTGTGNLLQLQKSGTDKFVVDNSGNVSAGNINASATAANSIGTAGQTTFYGDGSNLSNLPAPSGVVKTTPSSAQTILPSADVVPLIIQDDAAGTTANLLDVQNNAGTSLVKVSGSGKLLVGSPTTTTQKVSVYETGTQGAGYFEIFNAANNDVALYAQTNGSGGAVTGINSGFGPAGEFQITNAASGQSALSGITSGAGNAGNFQITNAASGANALKVSTNGTGNAVYGYNTGTGQAGIFEVNNAANAASLIAGTTTGTGNLLQLQKSGVDKFVVDNTGTITVGGASDPNAVKINPSSAQTILPSADVVPLIIKDDAVGTTANLLDVQNNAGTSLVKVSGSGKLLVGSPTFTTPKLSVYETGTNIAVYFEVNNAANTQTALDVSTNGTGRAGSFGIINAANFNPALFARTSGTGQAGYFQIFNPANADIALYAETNGTGPAGKFEIINAANANTALLALTNGTGRAGLFQIINAANTQPALFGATNGTGIAVQGTTSGTGQAGYFQIGNPGSAASALYVTTNGTGKYIDASNGAFLSNAGIWTNASSRVLKQDIAPLTNEQYEEALNKLLKTDVVYFKYKKDPSEVHIGIIAEDAPEEMVDPEKKGVYTADSIGMLLAALKAQQKQIEMLKEKISILEGK